MKLVTFTRDMRPHSAGDTRVVPDVVAAQLVEAGDVDPNPPSFPTEAPVQQQAAEERQTYRTKRR
ncbi:hypothetical protein OGR47_02730 [Methylocystis sp. MJC1]|uniref:hypothetical protein n=1 Tax=Methylocystis sp. MJC1 TaxID=2654282 RepID=UPI0013EACBE8|nr:hypothetical protein [Methylocystis sp. MJC1]KAF2991148.1 hypothetical protein MJC1_01881 [Methylocystis sp. MJC1]MBU6525929.1 hypothetical protein [Methylocystis sp. MJC1]UZX12395.1 hypothetical protein OGR47_02730 [Methylocystis sp. MJC1]